MNKDHWQLDALNMSTLIRLLVQDELFYISCNNAGRWCIDQRFVLLYVYEGVTSETKGVNRLVWWLGTEVQHVAPIRPSMRCAEKFLAPWLCGVSDMVSLPTPTKSNMYYGCSARPSKASIVVFCQHQRPVVEPENLTLGGGEGGTNWGYRWSDKVCFDLVLDFGFYMFIIFTC